MNRSLIFIISSLCLLPVSLRAQVLSLNGIYVTAANGTVIRADTVYNNSGSTLANEAAISVASVINAGTMQGSGIYAISNIFLNTGTFTPNSSTVNFNGTEQNIPGLLYYNLSTSGSGTKTVSGTVNMLNALSIGANTTLDLGSNNIRLKSDSTYTARVSTLGSGASISYGTGRFVAERYVKGRRKYRLFTSPVTSSSNATLTSGEEGLSIWGNWQNSGNNVTANAGTFITGGIAADGFDSQTTNPSLFTYNSSTRTFTAFTSANGKNTKYTPLKAGTPYYMFIWGDRTNSAITANPNKTIITSTGKILTGDQTYNTSTSIPLTNTVNGFSLVGNPFASPVDWATITRTNISDTYWGWDPNLNSTGGYVTVTSTGTVTLVSPFSGSVGLDQYIQSGQSFFVKTTASSPVMVIKESDKVGNYNALTFRTESNNIPLIAVNVFYDEGGTSTLMDGTLAAFDSGFSNEVTNDDALKMKRPGEELSIFHNGSLLSIDQRQLPVITDTIYLYGTSLTKAGYRLQIFSKYMAQYPVPAWLEDTYLQTGRQLSYTDTNKIIFSVNKSVAASSDPKRFRIVFGKSSFTAPPNSEYIVKPALKIVKDAGEHKLVFRAPGLEPGNYVYRIFNSAGQLVASRPIAIENGNDFQYIGLPSILSPGSYFLQLAGAKIKVVSPFIIH